MNKIQEFDQLVRKIISIFYRIILVFYSCCILFIYSPGNYFPLYIYGISLLVYVSLSYFLITKKSAYSKVRLLLDYSLIVMVLYEKPIDSLLCMIFLLLPIFNAPNFSGAKRSYFALYAIAIISYFILGHHALKVSVFIPFLCLFLISYFEYIRSRAFNFYYGLTNSISEFYDSRKKLGNEFKIYDDIIRKFNQNRFSRICTVETICSLFLKDGTYTIRNSSTFFINFEIEDYPEFVKKVHAEELFSNILIKFNGGESRYNIAVPLKKNGGYVVFFIIGKRSGSLVNSSPFIRDKVFLSPFLKPFFSQLSDFFDTEFQFRKDRFRKFEKIRGEYEYVLRTINAVHFIRNRLTPFKNYLEMTTDLANNQENSVEVRQKLQEIVASENERSKSTLKEILVRVKQILEEGDNPFNVTKDISPIEIKVIQIDLRNILSEIFESENIVSELSATDYERKVMLSHKGITIVLSDIISNINKHGNGVYNVFLMIVDDSLLIKFSNKFQMHGARVLKLKELSDYFASDENYNIFKMSSKGAFLIKDFCRQMGVEITAHIDEATSTFTIELTINIIP